LAAAGWSPICSASAHQSMLADIERQLEHFVTGRYSAAHRHADA
jgi:hypothetical protein